ncbi:biosynthetic peptidoglycan transglycosylase [Jatrophihabitans sp. DSM 44399]|uniref:peptidoglycan glycosyltransferase n=1 Tax=Jatrophihabitans lederbergiae TaxID=3075547 RepID=A0ABU2JGN0_9ACTN|nr:biosynthetic peptidoglycan transglycosylase [Jatrophihabitans sp. DSM 44399]
MTTARAEMALPVHDQPSTPSDLPDRQTLSPAGQPGFAEVRPASLPPKVVPTWSEVRLYGQSSSRPRRRWRRRALITLVSLLLSGALTVTALMLLTPGVSDAEARVHASAAAHGATDPGGQVPALFAQSLVATEDSRFFSHHGIDSLGVLRAVSGPLRGGGDPGGSTLDQQLAKQLYTGGQGSAWDKVVQVSLAVKLDAAYSKQQILEMYAATVYFGNGYYGLAAAACGYFGVPPARLNDAQSTLLAGLPQAPSAYDPVTHLSLARSRQRHVLDRLVAVHTLTAAQADAVFSSPLHLATTAGANPTCR